MEDLGGGTSIELWLSRGEELASQAEIQHRVWDELRWDPCLEGAELQVEVSKGVVTLRGNTRSYLERVAAERAAGRAVGVKAVENELRVSLSPDHMRTDQELTDEVCRALQWTVAVPAQQLHVLIEAGQVTLEGEVEREAQRALAEEVVAGLEGVRDLSNHIAVRPSGPAGPELEARLRAALEHAGAHIQHLKVENAGGRVVLRGRVRTLAERTVAEHAAWSVPGVAALDDQLQIA